MNGLVENYENYRNLAYEIILQSVIDYENALSILQYGYADKYDIDEARREKERGERFFRSAWFGKLSCSAELDGDFVIRKCNDRVKDAKPPVYDEKKKKYMCANCGNLINSISINAKAFPIIKCTKCMQLTRLM